MSDFSGCLLILFFMLIIMAFYPTAFLVLLAITVILTALGQFIGMFWD